MFIGTNTTKTDNKSVSSQVFLPKFTVALACLIVCWCTSVYCANDTIYTLRTIVGNGNTEGLKVNVPALEASFGDPYSIVQSKNGDLYFAPRNKHAVLKVEFNELTGTSNVIIVAGTGSPGTGTDDIPGTECKLNNPYAVSLIEDRESGRVNALLIADSNNHRIRKLDMKTQKINTIVGTGTAGDTGESGKAIEATLKNPRHVHYDQSTGDIYIVDYGNNKVKRVRDGTIMTVVGRTCTDGDDMGDDGQAIDACLNRPTHFTINAAGEWFIADRGNARVRKVDLDGTIMTAAGGGSETGDAPAKEVKLTYPVGVTFNPSGDMFVGDSSIGPTGWIRQMGPNGILKVIAGGGETSVIDGIFATAASVFPLSVAYTTHGILIGDQRGRILQLSLMQCYGIELTSATVCSGHGSCISPDHCQCDDGWMGVDCSITHCFGFTSNHPNVCSGKGRCVRHNKCHCDDEFGGHICQLKIK